MVPGAAEQAELALVDELLATECMMNIAIAELPVVTTLAIIHRKMPELFASCSISVT